LRGAGAGHLPARPVPENLPAAVPGCRLGCTVRAPRIHPNPRKARRYYPQFRRRTAAVQSPGAAPAGAGHPAAGAHPAPARGRFVAGQELNVAGLADGRGHCLSAVAMRKLTITDKGKAWAGITIEDESLSALAHRFAEVSQWRGAFELELLRTPTGELFILEINPRFPAWIYLTAAAGHNQPAALLRLALGEAVEPFGEVAVGKMFVRCAWDLVADYALGLGMGAAVMGSVFAAIFDSFSLITSLSVLGGMLFLGYCLAYCRVTITPWEVRVLGSGIWKGRYSCPLEAAAVEGYWVLPELAASAGYHSAALNFSSEEDWDSGTPYIDVLFYGEQIINCFRTKHLNEIQAALETMKNRRLRLDELAAN
nr:hypothetical protein [Tanacetum cinerariifolium]